MTVTYSSYLHLDELLAAQQPLSEGPEHDEMLFIVIHQVYELWFKQLLHEAGHLGAALEQDDLPRVYATLKRFLTILKVQVAQIDILETMSPVSFLSFRERLDTASGFQSPQFRELEFVLGRRSARMIAHHAGTPAADRLAAMLYEPSLWDQFVQLPRPPRLRRAAGAARARSLPAQSRNAGAPAAAHRDLPHATRPAQICERLVDLDEGIQEWRYRHVKMVERTIGTKAGTGGSSGVEYLRATLFQPLFPDLWAIRASL